MDVTKYNAVHSRLQYSILYYYVICIRSHCFNSAISVGISVTVHIRYNTLFSIRCGFRPL